MGTPIEIINQVFGGKKNYEQSAIRELEQSYLSQPDRNLISGAATA
jgi:hypothetical protein